ncbi:hypothetical protein GH714_013055 [Hevea brasiliensis]|uniref:Uncharacterized protein n=1 Tax=Hevea brasiliensis TaxID=3981 RepID=A0A6A6LJY0_HEVBR|nr:hypothetical protein GH714_013055 [Hevea brasiliensis]
MCLKVLNGQPRKDVASDGMVFPEDLRPSCSKNEEKQMSTLEIRHQDPINFQQRLSESKVADPMVGPSRNNQCISHLIIGTESFSSLIGDHLPPGPADLATHTKGEEYGYEANGTVDENHHGESHVPCNMEELDDFA